MVTDSGHGVLPVSKPRFGGLRLPGVAPKNIDKTTINLIALLAASFGP